MRKTERPRGARTTVPRGGKRGNLRRYLVMLIALGVVAGPALGVAQVKQLGANATTQDFISGLSPSPGAPGLKFRGLRVFNANPTDAPEGAPGPAVAVDIKFAFASATLSDQAKGTLKQMAAAMKSAELAPYHFLLEGHTDSTGGADYNLALSKKRAEAVRSYLVERFGIESARLEAVGRGPAAPLDPDHPESPVNRRVQVVNLGS